MNVKQALASDMSFPACLDAQVGRIAGGSRHPLPFASGKTDFDLKKPALTSFSLYTTSPILKDCFFFF